MSAFGYDHTMYHDKGGYEDTHFGDEPVPSSVYNDYTETYRPDGRKKFTKQFVDDYQDLMEQSTITVPFNMFEDKTVYDKVVEFIQQRFPVRSGLLADQVILSLKIGHTVETESDKINIYPWFTFNYPSSRPRLIGGRVQHTSELGTGDKYTPINVIRNRSLIKEYATSSLYLLNDPVATNSPYGDLNMKIEQEIKKELERGKLYGLRAFKDTGISRDEQYEGLIYMEENKAEIEVPFVSGGSKKIKYYVYKVTTN